MSTQQSKPRKKVDMSFVLLAVIGLITASVDAAQINTWILSGQSNAEGYAITHNPVSGLQPPDTLADIDRSDLNVTHYDVCFYQGQNDYNGVSSSAGMNMAPKNTWHAMEPYEGLCYDWGSGRGGESGRRFGPELAFAYETLQSLGTEIAMVKFARSSASLASTTQQLWDGLWNDYDPSDNRPNQYDKLITTVNGAVASLAVGDTLSIQGVLWMQGESDTNAGMASSYEANLTEFIAALRSEMSTIAASSGAKMVPATSWDELKFFIGTIYTPTSYGDTVRAGQNAVAAADPDVYIVNGYTGVSMMTVDDWSGNGVHYDTVGQVLLGERFAAAVFSTTLWGDLTGDGKVNLEDVAELGAGWQSGYDLNTLLDIADSWLYGTTP